MTDILHIDILNNQLPHVDLLNRQDLAIPLYNGLGGVELLDMMPRMVPVGYTADRSIATSARISYLSDTNKTATEDAALIRRLLKDRHTSPFESVVFKFKIKCPIFVERQLVRHRTASLNEQSARYTVLDEKYYYPDLRMQSLKNKQGSREGDVPLKAMKIWKEIADDTHTMYKKYLELIELGVTRELARCCLPVSFMTEMVWSMNLHNLLHFLRLRMAADAQQEIRELANAIYQLIKPLAPVTCEAFDNWIVDSITISKKERAFLNDSCDTISISEKRELERKMRELCR